MTDIEITKMYKKDNIINVAKKLGLNEDNLILYGNDKAKIKNINIEKSNSKLILVTAINPTPYGEGKTTVSIGLNDALAKLQKKTIAVLREPSMGPVFGMKGGATGGGHSQVVPMEDINLHFTGDFHAITSANNLLSAAIDNHIYQGNELNIDKVVFKRCLDVNDRALRDVSLTNREEKFNITAASEIMAIFCLASDIKDLERRLGNIIIGYTKEGDILYAKNLHVEGAMTVLLKDALYPNLVQSLEQNPVIIHGGPFANIAHGCNSIIATKTGLSISDYVVTEAGFGADLGAEKFFDIKCLKANIAPDAIVLVATIKALKYNANIIKEDILKENDKAVLVGLSNLMTHVENIRKYGLNPIVCLNKYDTDTEKEISTVENFCLSNNISFAKSTAYNDGGVGALDLAEKVIEECNTKKDFHYLYDEDLTVKEKINIVCKEIYRASNINYSEKAQKEIEKLSDLKYPVCIAKTQYSLSDNPKLLGSPKDFSITVKDLIVYNGAEIITVLLGNIMTMPALPKHPNYENITIDSNKEITGIF